MSDWLGCPDDGRAVIALDGRDMRAALQGVVTNDVTRLAPDRPVYAALLTPQGKYLFDFLLIETPERIWIDVAAPRAAALAQRLGMYCLRRDARVLGPAGVGVALAWGGGNLPDGPGLALADPRAATLGWRLYAADPAAALAARGVSAGTRAAYDARRIAAGVPDSDVDLIPDETFILEAGFEALGGVDFRKGCYVGQEVTARMKHKATLRRRLMPVRVEGTAPPGTPILAGDRPAGTLRSQAGARGLAELRLDRIEGVLMAGTARVVPDPL